MSVAADAFLSDLLDDTTERWRQRLKHYLELTTPSQNGSSVRAFCAEFSEWPQHLEAAGLLREREALLEFLEQLEQRLQGTKNTLLLQTFFLRGLKQLLGDQESLQKTVLLATYGQHWLALPIDCVIELLPAVEVNPLPLRSGSILGLLGVRGEPLPLMDMHSVLCGELREPVQQVDCRYNVICQVMDKKMVLPISSVEQMVTLQESDFHLKHSKHSQFAVATYEGRTVIHVDLEKLFS